jgi:DnaK suppressor protein
MPDVDLAETRRRLIKLQQDLELESAAGKESAQIVELDQSRVGRLSRMDAMQAQAMAQASGQRRQMLLKAIDGALLRLDNDSYGFCQECEGPVSGKRLEFDPTASLCIQCAEAREA